MINKIEIENIDLDNFSEFGHVINKESTSEKISITDKPPPLTKYLSTPGGKALKPGFLISLLVPNILTKLYIFFISLF